MKIGFFDSGLGGLSVLHLAMRRFSEVEFLYYADRKNVPYGEKSKEEIIGFVDEVIRFFMERGTDAVVIACNTATSAAVHEMRKRYDLPIIGMEPAVKKALEMDGEKKVLVAATPITVRGEKMSRLLEQVDKSKKVDLIPLPKLVRFAEKGIFDSLEVQSYLDKELWAYPLQEYSSLVLGCTHFNYFKDSFRKILPEKMNFVDGNEGTLNRLASFIKLKEANGKKNVSVEYYFSGERVHSNPDKECIEHCMKRLDAMLDID